jgi:hypothetical protein
LPEAEFRTNSGWLVLDSAKRRGYSFTEALDLNAQAKNATIIESFDLDTLRPLKRTMVAGVPIASGAGADGPGTATFAGDMVHAVDSEAGRLYVPIHKLGTNTPGGGNDTQRLVSYVLVIDEEQFDVDPAHAFGTFAFTGAEQHLAGYPLLGLAVSRHHAAPGKAAKVLGVFASAYPLSTVNVVLPLPAGVVYDHVLAQWDPSGVPTGRAAPPALFAPGALVGDPLPADWAEVLVACGRAPMTSAGSEESSSTEAKNFQWEILPMSDAVYLGCQSAPGSGAVVRVGLDETGRPALGASQRLTALGKPIGDVLVDPGGGRLYLRSFGGGATWWAFDAATMRFAGSIAAHLTDVKPMAAGIDEGTGRLYTLTPDTCAPRQGGGEIPFRGGIKMAEARLDPVPAQENLRPDMAYNSWWRIHVDSVTRRVYVRRGVELERLQLAYPECDLRNRAEAPQEPFYRVFEDRVPVANQPGELDDAPFTTNVPEAKGLTQASFLGSGGGYGARVSLTGGLDAVTSGFVTEAHSLCGREDRELLAGSVGGVEVSDQSTRAEAASLDADSRTQEALGDPISRCRPQAPTGSQDPTAGQGENLNRCHGDTEELAFDDKKTDDQHPNGIDENKDGCLDRTAENRYLVHCTQTETPQPATGPENRKVNRDGFKASTKCDAAHELAKADAEGAIGSKLDEEFSKERKENGISTDPLRVGRSSSSVTVTRVLGEGITVTVDSIARGVEIPGVGTIGVVRSEAVSKSTGRDGRAQGEYKRTICAVSIGRVEVPGCLGEEQLTPLAAQINNALGGRGEVRFRRPDKALLDGTAHGYLAAVQRDRKQLFGDQTITRDRSLAVPALEFILFQGEGGPWGAGRQVIQLAGAQASTSYGIACTYGQAPNGSCAKDGEGSGQTDDFSALASISDEGTGGSPAAETVNLLSESSSSHKDPLLVRVLKKVPQAIAQAVRLLFNNPRELGLMAAVWGLLYAPCYLGERRRRIRGLQARRAIVGGVG